MCFDGNKRDMLTAVNWWLSSPYSATNFYNVNNNGTSNNNNASNTNYWARPALWKLIEAHNGTYSSNNDINVSV